MKRESSPFHSLYPFILQKPYHNIWPMYCKLIKMDDGLQNTELVSLKCYPAWEEPSAGAEDVLLRLCVDQSCSWWRWRWRGEGSPRCHRRGGGRQQGLQGGGGARLQLVLVWHWNMLAGEIKSSFLPFTEGGLQIMERFLWQHWYCNP